MAADPRHRTAARTLRRIAHSPLLYETASTRQTSTTRAWDHFRIRNIGLAVGRQFAASRQTAAALGVTCAKRVARALSLKIAALTLRQRHAFERLAPSLALIPDLNRGRKDERYTR